MSSDRLAELLDAALTAKGTPLIGAEEVLELLEYSRTRRTVPRVFEAYQVHGDVRSLVPQYSLRLVGYDDDPEEQDSSREDLQSYILDLPAHVRSEYRFSLYFGDEPNPSAK